MTPEDVRNRVELIDLWSGDDETSHSIEDELYRDVLEAVSVGSGSKEALQEIAREALKTRDLVFSRWCS